MVLEEHYKGIKIKAISIGISLENEEVLIQPSDFNYLYRDKDIVILSKKEINSFDEERVKKIITEAVLSINFPGYDKNSEKALITMQAYILKGLGL